MKTAVFEIIRVADPMAMKLKQQIEIKQGGRVPPPNFETANTLNTQHSLQNVIFLNLEVRC